jgi:hypothetical protein
MREPGIYDNVNIDEYHAEEGISSTGISLIMDCPKRFWHEYIADVGNMVEDNKNTKDKFMLGRAVHMLCLEPDKFHENFLPMPEKVNLTTKVGKELYATYEDVAQGRQIIRSQDWFDIQDIARAVRTNSMWDKVKEGKVEQSIYWDSGIYNTRLRARPDFFNDQIIIDLKTTDSIPAFGRSIYAYGYHRQAAMQIDALYQIDGIKRFFAFFVVEKKAPFLTACFTLDEESIEQGRREYLDGAATYSECLKASHWPGYDEKFQLLSLPNYAKKGEDNV